MLRIMIRICLDMSATLIHHGHIRLIKNAKIKYPDSYLIIALTSDIDVFKIKGYNPELNFKYRKEILENIKGVDEVIESPWEITKDFINKHNIDYLVHGSDNSNKIENLFIISRTKGVSSSLLREKALNSIISKRNRNKIMYTPGPASLFSKGVLNISQLWTR